MKTASILIIAILGTALSASAQQIYKWKDDKGQWRFSDTPPADVQELDRRDVKASFIETEAADPALTLGDSLEALAREFTSLGNSTAAIQRKKQIPADMQSEVGKYRSTMRSLIAKASDEGVRLSLHRKMEAVAEKAGEAVLLIRSQSLAFFRARCLEEARATYEQDWKAHCPGRWLSGSCSLPVTLVQVLDDRYRDARGDCHRLYPE